AFVGTHDHIDHIDHDAWKIWAKNNPDAKFIFPRKHMESVLKDGIARVNATGLNDGESYQIGDITIHAFPASHEFLDRDENGLYPYLQYVIEARGRYRKIRRHARQDKAIRKDRCADAPYKRT
ncbi:MAG: MBL fold metallo-hydrolase, partial [Oscillospiraceae bacterium]|nr:MBL fold metallo-hydrolase [Oscillospiraceae bacterium]